MRLFKKAFAFVCAFSLAAHLCVSASVLGSNQISSYEYEISKGLSLVQNKFLSDQSGVGMQSENYFYYLPNSETRPIVTTGEYVYGGSNINDVYSYLTNNGINTTGGINGDFFSMQTGVPMGQVVIDKRIITDDGDIMPAIGFNSDGSAFIDDYKLTIKMWANGEETILPFYNKYLQEWNYYLFDSRYYNKITPSVKASYITFEVKSGEPIIGGVVTTEIVDIQKDLQTEKKLNENQLVLAVTDDALQELKDGFDKFFVGETVEFTFNTNNNEKWGKAKHILASKAGRILENAQPVGDLSGIASPRTAVGITNDGAVIFYTIDGRQPGYSYGIRLPTLVTRLQELGCVDALNLDGGGSTVISAIYAGTDEFKLLNSPSDGALRNDATYIFFENTADKTGNPERLYIYPSSINILSGSVGEFSVKGADSGYYPVDLSDNLTYKVTGDCIVDNFGKVKAYGNRTETFFVSSGSISAEAKVNCIQTPDVITLKNKADNKAINTINLDVNKSIDLDALCSYKGTALICDDDAFTWSVIGEGATVSKDGILVGKSEGECALSVSAGDKIVNFRVTVNKGNEELLSQQLCDIDENWARNYIQLLYDKKVFTGEKGEDGNLYFKPFEYVDRTLLAVTLARVLDLDLNTYSDVVLNFKDNDKIPDYAVKYIKAVVGKGILKGIASSDGLYFSPDSKITRAEIFTTVGRILNISPSTKCTFSDRNEIPEWAVEYIDALCERGMVNGYSDNTLHPLANVTKAELSKIIVKSIFNGKE